jgi:site-specific DNA-cytosine methylase
MNKVKDYRSLTPQEAAVLQGMPPDTFTKRGLILPDAMAYKQLGNAVNVGVIRFLASRLIA